MNITFLIGNGFDNSLNIDTSYKSFYNWYCKQSNKNDNISKFKQHIEFGKGEYWSDFEVGLGNYTEYFTKETANEFLECYIDAQQNLIKYINIEKQQLDFESYNDEDFKKIGDGLINFFGEVNPTSKETLKTVVDNDKAYDTKINFISFNYTDLLDLFVDKISKSPLSTWTSSNGANKTCAVNSKVIHVHGNMLRFPIVGVDNENQIKNKDLLDVPDFKELMIKSESVNALGEVWHRDAISTIENSRIICIFGMSLGKTDEKWWKKILIWLRNSDARHLVLFWYLKDPYDETNLAEYLRTVREIRQKLFSYTNDDIKNIEKRVHIVINTKKVFALPIRKKQLIDIKITNEDKELVLV